MSAIPFTDSMLRTADVSELVRLLTDVPMPAWMRDVLERLDSTDQKLVKLESSDNEIVEEQQVRIAELEQHLRDAERDCKTFADQVIELESFIEMLGASTEQAA